MKKLFFAALAAVFMLSSGFSSIENDNLEIPNQIQKEEIFKSSDVEYFGTCNYSLTRTWTDADGNAQSETKNFSYTSENMTSQQDCDTYVSAHLLSLSLSLVEW
tara:strand:+ start:90 stop:401 length:312 start_codon:yes stop_codon:yes gene_type:complete